MKVSKYAKAVVGALVAAGGALTPALADGVVTNGEWVTVALAGLAALGIVWAVPNAKETPKAG
jgi:hypothetical protein